MPRNILERSFERTLLQRFRGSYRVSLKQLYVTADPCRSAPRDSPKGGWRQKEPTIWHQKRRDTPTFHGLTSKNLLA